MTHSWIPSPQPYGDNEQRIYGPFANGYGASVIRGAYTFGGPEGLWELAVIKWENEGPNEWHLNYETPITEDVIGHLTEDEVEELVTQVEALPPADVAKLTANVLNAYAGTGLKAAKVTDILVAAVREGSAENLYRLARTVNTLQAVAHPKRLPRRMKNIVIGRLLARAGIWRRLWS